MVGGQAGRGGQVQQQQQQQSTRNAPVQQQPTSRFNSKPTPFSNPGAVAQQQAMSTGVTAPPGAAGMHQRSGSLQGRPSLTLDPALDKDKGKDDKKKAETEDNKSTLWQGDFEILASGALQKLLGGKNLLLRKLTATSHHPHPKVVQLYKSLKGCEMMRLSLMPVKAIESIKGMNELHETWRKKKGKKKKEEQCSENDDEKEQHVSTKFEALHRTIAFYMGGGVMDPSCVVLSMHIAIGKQMETLKSLFPRLIQLMIPKEVRSRRSAPADVPLSASSSLAAAAAAAALAAAELKHQADRQRAHARERGEGEVLKSPKNDAGEGEDNEGDDQPNTTEQQQETQPVEDEEEEAARLEAEKEEELAERDRAAVLASGMILVADLIFKQQQGNEKTSTSEKTASDSSNKVERLYLLPFETSGGVSFFCLESSRVYLHEVSYWIDRQGGQSNSAVKAALVPPPTLRAGVGVPLVSAVYRGSIPIYHKRPVDPQRQVRFCVQRNLTVDEEDEEVLHPGDKHLIGTGTHHATKRPRTGTYTISAGAQPMDVDSQPLAPQPTTATTATTVAVAPQGDVQLQGQDTATGQQDTSLPKQNTDQPPAPPPIHDQVHRLALASLLSVAGTAWSRPYMVFFQERCLLPGNRLVTDPVIPNNNRPGLSGPSPLQPSPSPLSPGTSWRYTPSNTTPMEPMGYSDPRTTPVNEGGPVQPTINNNTISRPDYTEMIQLLPTQTSLSQQDASLKKPQGQLTTASPTVGRKSGCLQPSEPGTRPCIAPLFCLQDAIDKPEAKERLSWFWMEMDAVKRKIVKDLSVLYWTDGSKPEVDTLNTKHVWKAQVYLFFMKCFEVWTAPPVDFDVLLMPAPEEKAPTDQCQGKQAVRHLDNKIFHGQHSHHARQIRALLLHPARVFDSADFLSNLKHQLGWYLESFTKGIEAVLQKPLQIVRKTVDERVPQHEIFVSGVNVIMDHRPWLHCSAELLARLCVLMRVSYELQHNNRWGIRMRPVEMQRVMMYGGDEETGVMVAAMEMGVLAPLKSYHMDDRGQLVKDAAKVMRYDAATRFTIVVYCTPVGPEEIDAKSGEPRGDEVHRGDVEVARAAYTSPVFSGALDEVVKFMELLYSNLN